MKKTRRTISRGFRLIRVNPRETAARLWHGTAARSWLVSIALAVAHTAGAQVKPNADWRTIKTEHFSIHFTPELEEVARRAAVNAESSYVALSRHLRAPRGPIDVVISDDVDYTNGSATPYPTNRIVIYANPPVFEGALRFVDDPTELIVTHELTHIFHLDRAGGPWKVLQHVFGRAPFFFPIAFQPSWLVEGLAVYYESLLTGSGRIAGSEHRMIARAAALDHVFPRLDQLSLARPHFPYGTSAYAYGSLFMEYLARMHGDSAMRTFVESSSRQLIPMLLNPPGRRAFGANFTSEYRRWAESLVATAPPSAPPLPAWRDLTVDGAYASYPRWLNDSTLIYVGTPGRETYGAYTLQLPTPNAQPLTPNVVRQRLGRRSARSPNTLLPDGSLLYSQFEFLNPYNLRSDLYVDAPGGATRRITRGARLAVPDARGRDGHIVAVQIVPAGTRLVLVTLDGARISPITAGSPDEQWSEPRWSPDGNHIAAIRWTRGGTSEVVVVDTTGRVEQSLIRERAVNTSPSWSPDGRHVYFSSDRTGIANLYRAAFRPAFADTMMVPDVQRVSDAATGLFEPTVSPSGRHLAAVIFRADGYHVGIAPLDSVRAENAPMLAQVTPRPAVPSTKHLAPSTKYSAWRSVLPRYWMPLWETALDTNASRLGAYTSGQDVVGRHLYQALLLVPTDNSGITGSVFYRNAMLGRPLVDMVASQDWEDRGCFVASQGQCTGRLRRRIREATASLTFERPRVRSFSFMSVGGGVEVRDYATAPTSLRATLDTFYNNTYFYPRTVFSAGWSNAQRPPNAISAEDGFAFSSTTRLRWRMGDAQSVTTSVVASGAAFKSLDLPGFAHHVLAARVVGGVQNSRGTGYFELGGVSGGTLDVLPGYTLGEGRRTFSVRGFDAASLLGIRAVAGSIEYRAPFRMPGRGLGTLPLFLDRTSLTVFGDAGTAWCPRSYARQRLPRLTLCSDADVSSGIANLERNIIGSVGAELNVAAAILSWDTPYTYRLGVASPVMGTRHVAPLTTKKMQLYLTVGTSF